LRSDPSK